MKSFRTLCYCLGSLAFITAIININTGYISLSAADFFQNTHLSPIAQLRINRTAAMLLVGVSMPTSGFLLQEYFRNPLAGPSVLGISSVAGLAVALYIFVSKDIELPEFLQNGFISLIAISGSLLLILILLAISRQFPDKSFIIIFGFLLSALAGAIVSVLQLYSDNQSLKNYILWTFGANNHLTDSQTYLLAMIIITGLSIGTKCIKPLMGNTLGAQYAQSLGINLHALKYNIIIASSLLSASVTAFLGPILFIGIVVPHFCRMIYSPARLWQQWILNMIIGIVTMQFFSIFSEIFKLPINIITSLFGIPIICIMLLKKRI